MRHHERKKVAALQDEHPDSHFTEGYCGGEAAGQLSNGELLLRGQGVGLTQTSRCSLCSGVRKPAYAMLRLRSSLRSSGLRRRRHDGPSALSRY